LAYDAFVSYSHAADGQLAPALQSAMQRLARPWHRRWALRVFRDESALSANPHLWSSITTALDDAAWFVLLASPEAAGSEWVNREVDYWLANKSVERILPVVTDGTWEWDPVARRLTGSSVPAALVDAFADEPRHVDLRWAHESEELDLRNSRFRDVVAQLAAPMHGVAKDELESEDVRLHRRARRLARGGVSVLAVLVVISLVTTGFALVQRSNANHQRNRADLERRSAEEQALVAESGHLAALAENRSSTQLDLALLLAVQGHRIRDSVETRRGLLAALGESPHAVALQQGFIQNVTAAAFSPDRTLVALGENDGSVHVWNIAKRTEARAFPGQVGSVVSIAFSPDAHLLAVLSAQSARLFSTSSGRPIGAVMARPEGLGRNAAVEFDHRGHAVATLTGSGILALWAVPSGRPVRAPIDTKVGAVAMSFSPDDRTIATSSSTIGATSFPLSLVDVGSGAATTIEARDNANALSFNADGSLLAVGEVSGGLELFDVPARRMLWRAGGPAGLVTSVTFGPGGRIVSGTDHGSVVVWDATTGRQIGAPLSGLDGGIRRVAFTNDGTGVVAVGREGIGSWSLGRQTLGERVRARRDVDIESVAARGGVLATAGQSLWLWDPHTKRPRRLLASGYTPTALNSPTFLAVAVSNDGARLATIDPGVSLWDVARGRRVATVDIGDAPTALAFSPDSKTFATAGLVQARVKLFDVATRHLIRTSPRAADENTIVLAIAFSPDGRTLVTGSDDVRFFDVSHGTRLSSVAGGQTGYVADIAFSPDGNLVVTAGHDGDLALWDARTRQPTGTSIAAGTGPLGHVAFSPDGSTIAALSQSGVLTLWDVATRQQIGRPITAHTDEYVSDNSGPASSLPGLAYLDDNTVVTSSPDGSLTFWDLRPSSWERAACDSAGRNLTQAEWRQYVGDRPYEQTCAQWPAGT
jgi:WD40 repeat protein